MGFVTRLSGEVCGECMAEAETSGKLAELKESARVPLQPRDIDSIGARHHMPS